MGAWIEILIYSLVISNIWSLLSWERGLKYPMAATIIHNAQSLLSWERGLKSDIRDVLNKYAPVAPLVGAWIEIE